ncbi:MAG TPA: hypothetical protein VGM44_11435 [Polyangiaceae bacterium]
MQLNSEPLRVIENALDTAGRVALDERTQFLQIRPELTVHFDGNVSAVR